MGAAGSGDASAGGGGGGVDGSIGDAGADAGAGAGVASGGGGGGGVLGSTCCARIGRLPASSNKLRTIGVRNLIFCVYRFTLLSWMLPLPGLDVAQARAAAPLILLLLWNSHKKPRVSPSTPACIFSRTRWGIFCTSANRAPCATASSRTFSNPAGWTPRPARWCGKLQCAPSRR
jgi:hypothetical protein